jgi:parvulin-like peptidyl-prolyl isomerase
VRRFATVVVLALIALAGAVAPVAAQEGDYFTTLQSNDSYKESDKTHIRVIQLTIGLQRARRALVLLAADDPEDWKAGHWSSNDGYKLIRAVQQSMDLQAGRMKFPNPLIRIMADQLMVARRHLINANLQLVQGAGLGDAAARERARILIAEAIVNVEMSMDMLH